MTSTSAHHRIPALDGLRGLAVLMVVVSHVSSYHAELLGPAGVAIFFVLSGFLITSLLLAERDRFGKISWTDFYARRALRLFPALLLLVVLTPLVLWVAKDPRLHSILPGLLSTVFYVQDFESATGHVSVLAHAWSLSVEEQFYFVWPLLLSLIIGRARGDRGRITRTVRNIWVVALVWHVVSIALLSYDWTYYSPDSNAIFLLTGCLVACSVQSQARLRVPTPAAAGGLVLVCLAPLFLTRLPQADWREATLLMFPVVLVSALLVLGAATLTVLANPVLRWFGTISYGLYLWNWVFISLEPHGRALTGRERAIAGVLAIGAAAASWYFFEKPILRLKSRFQRVPQLPVATAMVDDGQRVTSTPGLTVPSMGGPREASGIQAPPVPAESSGAGLFGAAAHEAESRGAEARGVESRGAESPGAGDPGWARVSPLRSARSVNRAVPAGTVNPGLLNPGFVNPGPVNPSLANPGAVTATSETVPIAVAQVYRDSALTNGSRASRSRSGRTRRTDAADQQTSQTSQTQDAQIIPFMPQLRRGRHSL
ncbi:acyltransferase family protein [Kineosporia succinea]|uniref:Peptidoglycan/LPS O-acetylase OafA/YrhL n=1 Tax=Kineosporia succinea TaxID=84632 RepID=A0ABT9NVA8_9ACTN|nr:acyltransferase [Kineosporia succinea]MDP9824363.1 peptidoglycan/LPS O-acetylase OafA/YrhL [Kineosporia succinea]